MTCGSRTKRSLIRMEDDLRVVRFPTSDRTEPVPSFFEPNLREHLVVFILGPVFSRRK